MLGMLGYLTKPLLIELADLLAGSLNWSPERRQTELDRTVALLANQQWAAAHPRLTRCNHILLLVVSHRDSNHNEKEDSHVRN